MIGAIVKAIGGMQSLITLGSEKLADWTRKRLELAAEARRKNEERKERDKAAHLDVRCEPKQGEPKCD